MMAGNGPTLAPSVALIAQLEAPMDDGTVLLLALGLAGVLGVLLGLAAAARARRRRQGKAPSAGRKVRSRRSASAATAPAAVPRVTFTPLRSSGTRVVHAKEAPPEPWADPERGLRLTRDALVSMHTGGRTTRGKCSRCSTALWLSARRPLVARCPVCGNSRTLT